MDGPNVLLLILDSVRAENVSHLGYARETTPEIDQFANEATTYTNARSPGIHSISSHVSIFTGYHVVEHQATSHGAQISPGNTIWEELSEIGYQTGLFTPNSIVAQSSNLSSFFEHVSGPKSRLVYPEALAPEDIDGHSPYLNYLIESLRSESPFKSIINGLSRKFGSSTAVHDPDQERGETFIREFDTWRQETQDPWAACINLMDAHYPYLPQERFTRWGDEPLQSMHREVMGGPLTSQYLDERPFWELAAFENLYDDCIRQADAYVGELLNHLESAGELENTLVVVTSDHGEGFGEYSVLNDEVRLIDHSWGIGDELSHVPLVVKYPGSDGPESVSKPASLTRFPAVVRAALEDECGSFVPPESYTLTSSYRIGEPGNQLPLAEADREAYFGPWHAVCRERNGRVVVDAIRREDQVRYEPSLGNQPKSGCTDRDVVEGIVNGLSDVEISAENRSIDHEVEGRLEELGYIT